MAIGHANLIIMFSSYFNQQRLMAQNVLDNRATTLEGIVDTFDPATYTCVVRYQPEDPTNPTGALSPSLPIAALQIGNGFGILAAPNIGDQVYVEFIRGSNQIGVVKLGRFSNIDQAPTIQAGEIYLIHVSGSFIKLQQNGQLNLNGFMDINLTSPAINLSNGGSTDFLVLYTQLKSYLDSHVHTGVATGGSLSGVPNVLTPSSIATTVVKAQ